MCFFKHQVVNADLNSWAGTEGIDYFDGEKGLTNIFTHLVPLLSEIANQKEQFLELTIGYDWGTKHILARLVFKCGKLSHKGKTCRHKPEVDITEIACQEEGEVGALAGVIDYYIVGAYFGGKPLLATKIE